MWMDFKSYSHRSQSASSSDQKIWKPNTHTSLAQIFLFLHLQHTLLSTKRRIDHESIALIATHSARCGELHPFTEPLVALTSIYTMGERNTRRRKCPTRETMQRIWNLTQCTRVWRTLLGEFLDPHYIAIWHAALITDETNAVDALHLIMMMMMMTTPWCLVDIITGNTANGQVDAKISHRYRFFPEFNGSFEIPTTPPPPPPPTPPHCTFFLGLVIGEHFRRRCLWGCRNDSSWFCTIMRFATLYK